MDMAMTSIWSDSVEGYALYLGQVDGYADIFGSVGHEEKVEVLLNIEKSTLTCWEKDAPPPDQESVEFVRFKMVRNLAIEHAVQVI